jgi:predicted esterase
VAIRLQRSKGRSRIENSAALLDTAGMRKQHPSTMPIVVDLPFEYELRKPASAPEALAILIHGFGETGKVSYSKLEKIFPEEYSVFAPTAPFPVPKWKGDLFIPAYSWYFFNPNINTYLVDMRASTELMIKAIERIGGTDLPKVVIGFSQGGYFGAHLAQKLKNVRQMIGIGCQFLEEEMPGEISFRMDQIFGAKDEVISLDRARKSHADLLRRGVVGEFFLLESVGHEITDSVVESVKACLKRGTPEN